MLNVLQHNHVGEVLVVVSRYFGGIKLGAGGLVRSYSSATEQAISQLKTVLKVRQQCYQLIFEYSYLSSIEYLLAKENHCEILDKTFASNITLKVALPINAVDTMIESIKQICQQHVEIVEIE